MVVQPTLADANRTGSQQLGDCFRIAHRIESAGVMRVHTRGEPYEIAICVGDLASPTRDVNGFADTDDADRACAARAFNGRLTVRIERRVSQVSVAIEKHGHDAKTAAIFRGGSRELSGTRRRPA